MEDLRILSRKTHRTDTHNEPISTDYVEAVDLVEDRHEFHDTGGTSSVDLPQRQLI